MTDRKAEYARKANTPWRESHIRGQELARNIETYDEREAQKEALRLEDIAARLDHTETGRQWRARIDRMGKG